MPFEEQTAEQAALVAARDAVPAGQEWLAASLGAVLDGSWEPDSQHTLGVAGTAAFRGCDIDTGETVPIVDLHVLYAVEGEPAADGEDLADVPGVVHGGRIVGMAPPGRCLHNAADGSRLWFWTAAPE